jgi:cAMP-dependent protein kinase regulator
VRTSESPLDHALTLLLAGEVDAAMRWAAAVLERAPSPGALLVTCRLLDQMGRTRAAVDGLRLVVQQAVDRGDLPLAAAAIDDLRVLGVDVGEHLESVASAFCRGSHRLHRGTPVPQLPPAAANDFVQPLSPFLAGPALASKATQIVQANKRRYEEALAGDLPSIPPLPLFSALTKGALKDVLSAFHVTTVPAGHRIIIEGDEGNETYVVVRGEVAISRHAAHGDNKFTLALARLGAGAFFGEMALLSLMPSPSSATATRPSLLLSARREALVDIAANRPEIAGQLAAHCRRNSLANLGWTSQVVAAVPPDDRASLVERLEMRVFDKGDQLVRAGEDSPGLHLIVSGEVAIVAKEWGERILLATLGAGETVGEMELVLCRQPFAEAVATRATATLFLSRDEYSSLIQDHPAILHGLYAIAVQRQAETSFALKAGSSPVADDWLLDAQEKEKEKEAAAPQEEPAEVPLPLSRTLAASPPPAAPASSPRSVPVERAAPPASRRTLSPPPLSATPASLNPTASSVPPSSAQAARPQSGTWVAPAAAAALAAIAASVVTIFAARPEIRGVSAPAAANQPVGVVSAMPLPPAAPSENTEATTASPVSTATGATATVAVPVTRVPAAASAAAPVQSPKPAVVKAVTASATPPAPPRRPAAQPAAAEAAPATATASKGASDADEFGGRQ